MSLAVDTERCMFFVGGNKAKSLNPTGSALAGGCTKEWWDAAVAADDAETALGKLMGLNGEPVASVSDTVHVNYDGAVSIHSVSNGFIGVEAGMLLYHPTLGGGGFYKVIEAQDTGPSYVRLDCLWDSAYSALDGDTVFAGGAWSDPKTLIENYVDATNFTQEVFVNKDLTPASQWDWSNWTGSVVNNTWLKVVGFHRVPGDITDADGAYYQTVKDMKVNGVNADRLVGVDMSGLGVDLIQPNYSYNITMRGFHFNNAAVGIALFDVPTAEWKNMDFEHCAVELSDFIVSNKCRGLIITDSRIYLSSVHATAGFAGDVDSVLILKNNYIDQTFKSVSISMSDGVVVDDGNVWDLDGADRWIDSVGDAVVLSMNNTILNYANTPDFGIQRVNHGGGFISINDLILAENINVRAFAIGAHGGTFNTKNLCAYSEAGQLTELLRSDLSTGREHDIDHLLEVDPVLDSDHQSRNKKVLLGGSEVGGQKTTIGAISQEHQFVGRSTNSNPGRPGIIR